MTGTIGWWDYDDTDRPTLINRDSGERVRMGKEVSIAGKRPGQRWIRLDYLHDELEFPILACWMPEEGHIVVDYLTSVALWRQETNSAQLYPPYGTWVRVDDCIIDAIWCWPGVLDSFHKNPRRSMGPKQGVVGFIGGWCNGAWRSEFLRVSVASSGLRTALRKFTADNKEISLPLRRLMPLDKPAPSAWQYIDITSYVEHRELGYTHFDGMELVPATVLSRFVKQHDYQLPDGPAGVEMGGIVPQMRAGDDSRVFLPIGSKFNFGQQATEPTIGQIHFACLEAGLTGIIGSWDAGHNKSFSDSKMDEVQARYGSSRRFFEVNQEAIKREAENFGGVRPYLEHMRSGQEAKRDEYKIIDYIELGRSKTFGTFEYRTPGPWTLSAEARRRTARLLQDALLFWQGTDKRPECWCEVGPDILSYHRHDTVRIDSYLLGGWRLGYDLYARLGNEQPWTQDGFILGPFMRGN